MPSPTTHCTPQQSPDCLGDSPFPEFSHPTTFTRIITTSVPEPTSTSSTISIPSSRTSPLSTPSIMDTNTSLQNTPEGLGSVGVPPPSLPAALTLPEPMWPSPAFSPPTASPSALSDAIASSRGPGIIRRISRSARFSRRRGSTSNSQRDHSVGPTILRRRSDSRGVADNLEISDFELERHEDNSVDDIPEYTFPFNHTNALGIIAGKPGMDSIPEGGTSAPIRYSMLVAGTFLTKVTKKKSKNIKFRLDQDSAKVWWEVHGKTRSVYIDDIKEIRTREQARSYREECGVKPASENTWFTIIYSCDDDRSKGRKTKFIHLIAPDVFTFELWTNMLNAVSRSRIELMAGLAGTAEKSAKTLWRKTMDQKFGGQAHAYEDEKLDFPNVLKICRTLHINSTENSIRGHFDQVAQKPSEVLNQAQFLTFVRRVRERTDVITLFEGIKPAHNSELDRESFFAFLRTIQKIDVDAELAHWVGVFERFARCTKTSKQGVESVSDSVQPTMSFQAFHTFLTSASNSILRTPRAEYSLDRPLNEYFVSSSHNTYLLGRQVAGQSSVEGYISALQRGCRCIEVDCWDGHDNKPIVVHGRTLTTSCSFFECIRVIAKYAFVSSPYPLIISLEVHCSDSQQAVMTDIMKREFADALVTEPIDDRTILPSPEELKGKILIKVKASEVREKQIPTDALPGRRQRSFSSPWARPVILDNSIIPNSPLVPTPPSMSPPERPTAFFSSPRTSATSAGTIPTLASSADDSDSPPSIVSEKPRKKRTSNIASVLGELGVYTQGFKFTDFKSQAAQSHNHIFSFAERTFDKLCKPSTETKALLEAHNMKCLMRVYPSATRINSSNFDPIKFWRKGVQMAALNWQTYDLGRQINDAMFATGSDRSGYVLKPEELRYEDHEIPNAKIFGLKKKPKKQVKFSVNIISAQQLPRPGDLASDTNINPYVEFEMFCAEDRRRGIATGEGGLDASARDGTSGIGSPLRKRTFPVANNGYNPNWNENIAMTLETKYPSLVFVRWSVWNSENGTRANNSGGPVATFTAKLSTLQEGYRHLPLFNVNGEQYLFSTLFCKIDKESHVAIDELEEVCAYASIPGSPALEGKTSSRRDFFKRVLSRTNSHSKKGEQRSRAETTESGTSRSTTLRTDTDSSFSRSSTIERSNS